MLKERKSSKITLPDKFMSIETNILSEKNEAWVKPSKPIEFLKFSFKMKPSCEILSNLR